MKFPFCFQSCKIVRMAQLTIKLVGSDDDQGTVVFGDFTSFCDTIASCLRRIENIVSPGIHLIYRVSKIESGSVQMTLDSKHSRAARDYGADVFGLFRETVSRLENGIKVHPNLTQDDLRSFRKLAEPLNRNLKAVQINDLSVTTQLIANVDKLASITIPIHGSVKGRLQRINLHNVMEFVIYPQSTGVPVTCEFEEQLEKKVCKAINKSVTVFGILTFKPDKPFPERVQVINLEIHPANSTLPKLSNLRGAWKGCKGLLTAVEFVRSIRDD